MSKCFRCGRELTADEIGAYLKLVNRGADKFLCIGCLASDLNTTEEHIRKKIEEFRKSGCTLFC